MSYTLSLPAWSIGTDCYDEIYKYAAVYGKRAAVIGGHTALSKAYDAIKSALAGTDFTLTEPIWYGGNATYENADMLADLDAVKEADMIFAVGGGRAMDTCKVASAKLGKPLFAFPTLGSNCASCTACAVMYYPSGEFKDTFYGKRCPIHTFINTAVVADSPAEMLWAGIGDSLAKEFESGLASRGIPLSHVPTMGTTIAHACTHPLMYYGPKAMELIKAKKTGPELDECVLAVVITAGLVSNMTISTDDAKSFMFNSSLAHCFYYAATVIPACAEHHVHGELVSFGIQVLMAFDKQWDELKAYEEFSYSMGLPITLGEIDLKPEDLPAVAAKAADGSIIEWEKLPMEITEQSFIDAILEADKRGREFLASKK